MRRDAALVESNDISCNQEAFAAWASCYDAQANPLLMLEERYLKKLFPDIAGRDVLDAGCGSGRWLRHFAHQRPASLKGIDASEEMLRVTAEKKIAAELFTCSCIETPFSEENFDLILSSFVLSYVGDLRRVAAEMSRIARDGCDLFISDMHPETERLLGWKRSFTDDRGEVVLHTHRHDLEEIIRAFNESGWTLRVALGPEFGVPEREVFAMAGRLKRFHQADGNPAIYILHLQKSRRDAKPTDYLHLHDGRCAIGPAEAQAAASLVIMQGHIESLTSDGPSLTAPARRQVDIDLSGYLVLPGLINPHDHLEFALFPKLASRRYLNATEWAEDIHNHFADVISLHRSVPLRTRLWWGGLRNLLCGVTTVCHHNPLLPGLLSEDFPVRVVQHYGWGHSVRFGGDLGAAHATTPKDAPFIVHACEGVDADAHEELEQLERLCVLDHRTVLVHGLALTSSDMDLLRRRGVSLILCPSSNHFLFGEVPARNLLEHIEAIALGSDSPLTACGDLLDEVRFAAAHCDISPHRLYSMVTDISRKILRLQRDEGSLRISASADLIAVRDTHCTPAKILSTLTARDVELVLRDGQVQLASQEIFERLPIAARSGMALLSIEGSIRWLRGPVSEHLAQAEEFLGNNRVRLGGKRVWLPSQSELDSSRRTAETSL